MLTRYCSKPKIGLGSYTKYNYNKVIYYYTLTNYVKKYTLTN